MKEFELLEAGNCGKVNTAGNLMEDKGWLVQLVTQIAVIVSLGW